MHVKKEVTEQNTNEWFSSVLNPDKTSAAELFLDRQSEGFSNG